MIIGNNFQRLHSPYAHAINKKLFTINDHLVPIEKLRLTLIRKLNLPATSVVRK